MQFVIRHISQRTPGARRNRTPFGTRPTACLAAILSLLWCGLPRWSSAQIESPSFPVVQLEESARVAALGGRSPALRTPDATALFSNPALLSSSEPGLLSFSYLNHVGDLNAGWVSYGRRLDSLTTVAAGIRYLGFGSIDRADDQGTKDGTFGASDMSLSVGASRQAVAGLTYGLSANFLLSSIDGYHATAFALDAGLQYEIGETGSILGLSVQNAGVVASSFGRRRDRLPFDVRIGFSRRLVHMPLLISVAAYRLHRLDGGPDGASAVANVLYHLVFGGEFQFSDAFQVRFGYNHRRHDELKLKSRLDLAGFSMGVGLNISRVAFDYAFNSWSSLGGLHRFSVRTAI